ncbi:MAG: GNAT family N-acetyltransferase [Herpetosiphonaceae bacterium]|nr:GNAT family N-acetyltransferase [Herpetosiphonaceae bacterium]
MGTEQIDLSNEHIRHELAGLLNACEDREPLFHRQISTDELPSLLTDLAAFQLEGQIWRNSSGVAEAFGYLRSFHVNGAVNSDLRFFVDPAIWNDAREGTIFDWGMKLAQAGQAEHGCEVWLYSDCLPTSIWRKAALECQGFAPIRYYYQLERPLQAPIPSVECPAGYRIRPVKAPADLPAWVDLFNAAYGGQWNYVPTTVEAQAALRQDQRYCNRYDLLVVNSTGTPVAFCLGFVLSRGGSPTGWVLEIGTQPALRNLGLGRTLLAALLRRFQEDDLATVRLAVDGENPSGAKRLYENLGFTAISSEIVYGLRLASGPQLASG